MIEWVTWSSIALAGIAGVVALIAGLVGRAPSDVTVGVIVVVELVLVALAVIAIVQPLSGNPPLGDVVEFWMYLGTALVMPPLVVVWAIVDRTRFGTVALGVVGLAISVMIVRMHVIWGG